MNWREREGEKDVVCNNVRQLTFEKHLTSLSIRWHRNTKKIRLGHHLNYVPDYYLPDLNTYVEVVGTKQAFAANRPKYARLVSDLIVNFLLTTPDFKPLHPRKTDYALGFKCRVRLCKNVVPLSKINERSLCPVHARRCAKGDMVIDANGNLVHPHKPKRRCSFAGCLRDARARGLCMAHYQQQRASGVLVPLRQYRKRKTQKPEDKP